MNRLKSLNYLFLCMTMSLFFEQYSSANKSTRFKLNYSTFEQLLIAHGFPKTAVPTMYCIAKHESGFNPVAYNLNKNRSFDVGLFQINQLWKKWCRMTDHDLLDVNNNVRCARIVLDKQGYKAWVTFGKFCQN